MALSPCVRVFCNDTRPQMRNKRRYKDFLGRVRRPHSGPETTIVVASIQARQCADAIMD